MKMKKKTERQACIGSHFRDDKEDGRFSEMFFFFHRKLTYDIRTTYEELEGHNTGRRRRVLLV